MEARHALHQVRSRMVPEIGADISYSKTTFASFGVQWVVIRRFVKDIDLSTENVDTKFQYF